MSCALGVATYSPGEHLSFRSGQTALSNHLDRPWLAHRLHEELQPVAPGRRPMKLKTAYELLQQTFSEWSADNAPRLGAALAYYTVFSIAPLLLIAIAIAGLVLGEQAAQGNIVGQIEDTVGPAAARAIQDLLKHAHTDGGSTLATAVGIVVLLFG